MNGGGSTRCVSLWCGEKCELLNCDETDCNGNGACTMVREKMQWKNEENERKMEI